MLGWLEDVAGPSFVSAVLWTLLALVFLVVLLVLVRLIRSFTFGTFVVGGRNRKTRLAVMDATAVDSHRRLVLVRRDDVEHLILIGGPTDVVVEQHIRLGQQRRVAPPQQSAPPPAPEQYYEPPPPPRPVEPVREQPREPQRAPQRQQAPQREQPLRYVEPYPAEREAPAPARTAPPQEQKSAPRLPPARIESPAPPVGRDAYLPRDLQSNPQPARNSRAAIGSDIDKALLDELTVSLDATKIRKPAKPAEVSLDDEMNKLLGELSASKR